MGFLGSESAVRREYPELRCAGPRTTINLKSSNDGAKITVASIAADAFNALDHVFLAHKFNLEKRHCGAQCCRKVRGSSKWSIHSWGLAADLNWQCVTGDTKIWTKDGLVQIGDLVNSFPWSDLLTRDPFNGGGSSWPDAPVKSYGEAEVVEVTLSRRGVKKKVRATENHRWFVYRYLTVEDRDKVRRERARVVEVETKDLVQGDKILGCLPNTGNASRTRISPIGVQAGLVFGDGSREVNRGSMIRLFGESRDLIDYFGPMAFIKNGSIDSGERYVEVSAMPGYFKDAPHYEESASYLLGWLAGYFAADGSVSKSGGAAMTSATAEHLEAFRHYAALVGIGCGPIRGYKREGFGGVSMKYTMSLLPSTVPESFFIRDDHRERFGSKSRKTGFSWTVESMSSAGVEEVFCPTVFETGAFTLDGFILTGNSNPMGRPLRTTFPAALIADVKAIRTNDGSRIFIWGGDWTRRPDSMHFTAAISKASLATGIDSGSVAGVGFKPTPGSTPAGQAPTDGTLRLTKPFMEGDPVKRLQKMLVECAKHAGLEADGVYGPMTAAHVSIYQSLPQRKLVQDGIAGPSTIKSLLALCEASGVKI